jgi:hypothetical protein
MLNERAKKSGMPPALYKQSRKVLPDASLVMLQPTGENIVVWRERLQTYLEATYIRPHGNVHEAREVSRNKNPDRGGDPE